MNTKPVKSILGKYGDYLKKAIAKSVYNSYEEKRFKKLENMAKDFIDLNNLKINPREYALMCCFDKGYEC